MSLDPHASVDSDWDTYDNPPRKRAWRPAGADCGISLAGVFQPGANPIQTSGQSQAAPPLAPPTPAYPAPGTGLISRAPAALGAPPGEESFTLPMGPPPPPDRERDYADPLLSVSPNSDWSPLPESSATDADVWSVTSTAPALSEAEAPPALRHLSEEAEALLLRYLGELYSVPADPAASQPQGSRLFRADAAQFPGIPLTADFKAVYDRIANEPTPTLRVSGFSALLAIPNQRSREVSLLGDFISRGPRLGRSCLG